MRTPRQWLRNRAAAKRRAEQIAWVEGVLGLKLLPWQWEAIDGILAGRSVVLARGRRGGLSTVDRALTELGFVRLR